MLNGPIIPKSYVSPTSIAPNPTFLTTQLGIEEGEIFTCMKTGRSWLLNTTEYKQMLPYVRNDGTPSQVSTVMSNDAGTMKIDNEAGSTAGEVNMFGSLRVNATSVKTPNLAYGEAFVDFSKQLNSSQPTQLQGTNDVTINTTITNLTNFNFIASEDGLYEYEMHATFFHNNSYNVSIGIRYFQNVSNYYYIAGTTVGAPAGSGGHWQSCVVKARQTLLTGESLRCAAAADVSGVLLKAQPQFTFPFVGPPTWTTYASYAIIRRIG